MNHRRVASVAHFGDYVPLLDMITNLDPKAGGLEVRIGRIFNRIAYDMAQGHDITLKRGRNVAHCVLLNRLADSTTPLLRGLTRALRQIGAVLNPVPDCPNDFAVSRGEHRLAIGIPMCGVGRAVMRRLTISIDLEEIDGELSGGNEPVMVLEDRQRRLQPSSF